MHLDAITRLRLSFAALALVMLAPLCWLFDSVERRVEAQRRLRHQVVAERIFDEVERELTLLLDRESERSSTVYDVETNPDAWASFVVGYFKTEGGRNVVLANDRLTPDRQQRMHWAAAQLASFSPAASASATQASESALMQKAPPKARSPDDVLRNLNRAGESRGQGTQQRSRSKLQTDDAFAY